MIARGNTSIGTGNLAVAGGGTLDLRDNAATTNFTVNGNLSLGSGTQGSNLYIELGNLANDVLTVAGNAAPRERARSISRPSPAAARRSDNTI